MTLNQALRDGSVKSPSPRPLNDALNAATRQATNAPASASRFGQFTAVGTGSLVRRWTAVDTRTAAIAA